MANTEKRTEVRGGGTPSKPIWKKWWFWVIIVVILGAIGTANSSDDAKEPTTEIVTENEEQKEPEPMQTETTEDRSEKEPTEETEKPSEPEETAETSEYNGKNIDDTGAHFSVSKVRNDTTDNWRISSIAENINIEEYALSYYKKYFSSDAEIHAIVNFSNNTTTKISVVGNVLDVSIYEYVDGEEHDAKLLFGGTLLKQYFVYTDTGEIEEIQ